MAAGDNIHGLYFPLVLEGGAPIVPGLADSIDSSLRILLSWEYSKRFFLYPFGSILSQLLGSPNSSALKAQIQQFLFMAISEWETRIILDSVELYLDEDGDSLAVSILGTIIETQTVYNYTTQI